jgi:hypothetical protein
VLLTIPALAAECDVSCGIDSHFYAFDLVAIICQFFLFAWALLLPAAVKRAALANQERERSRRQMAETDAQ